MRLLFVTPMNLMYAPFNAGDSGDKQRNQKEYFVDGDSQRDGDRDQDRRFAGMRMI